MEMLEKVELVREKCNVSFKEARRALEACGGDVLDAIVMLEQEQAGNVRKPATEQVPAPEATYVLPEAPAGAERPAGAGEHRTSRFASTWKRFCARVKELWGAGMAMTFVAERHGECLFTLPVAVVVLGLLFWGASLWLLVIGLFLGCRYRIEGESKAAETVNDAMGKVADAADSIKESIA